LNLLAREVQMAGYISPGQSLPVNTYPLFGCDSASGTVPFASPKAAGAMTCNAATGTTSAIEVVYEADDKTTVPQGVAKTPSDCLGTGITVSGTIYITRNRYYVDTSSSGRKELHCASPAGGGVAQPLIENVDDMQLWYGVTTAAAPTQVIRYAKAGKDVSTADTVNAQGAAEWNNVMSVRICLLMRSAEPILTGEDTLTYLDCNSASQTSADKYLRRAYFTTATVRTKMTS
jgi:type IV pilus assembly protein PilW